MEDILPQLEKFWQDHGTRIVNVLLVLVIGGVFLRRTVGVLREGLSKTKLDPTVASFLTNTVQSVLVVVLVFVLLQALGMQMGSLLTLLGTAGVAVALALQSSLANFAAGLLLLSYRLVRVGDLIEVGDVQGRVTELLPFHVVLVAADNERITLPNSLLTTGAVAQSHVPGNAAGPLGTGSDAAGQPGFREGRTPRRLLEDGRILQTQPLDVFVKEWSEDRRVLVVQAWTKTADQEAVQQGLLEELGAVLESIRSPKR